MTTLDAPAPAKAHPARQKAIQPYLDKLEAWCNSAAGSQNLDRAAKVHLGSQHLMLEPWERAQLLQFFAGSRTSVPALLAHGVAMVLKSTLDVEFLKQAESKLSVEIYALQAELMLDTAIGMALLQETDLLTAAEVQRGNVDTAKSLSVFRHKLSRGVAEAKKRIADSERQQAEALAGRMLDGAYAGQAGRQSAGESPAGAAQETSVTSLLEEEPSPILVAPRRRRRPGPRKAVAGSPHHAAVRAPGRTAVLAVSACVLAAIWFAAVRLPAILHADLQPIDATRIGWTGELTVVARPPSLFVTLPESRWVGMETSEQDALIDSVSAIAAREGYTGALVTTDTGKPVARWLRERGGERVPLVEDERSAP